jgi:hypothetical protein
VELGHEDGMPRDCVLNADHADTVAKGYLIEQITMLSPEDRCRLRCAGRRDKLRLMSEVIGLCRSAGRVAP